MAIGRLIPPGDVKLSPHPTKPGKRRVTLVSGPDYVRQKLSTRLKFFLGEWFRDLRQGIPYYRDVFIMNPDLAVIRGVYRAAILSVDEVVSLDSLSVSYNRASRTLAPSFAARTVDNNLIVVRQPDQAFIIDVARQS